jgi:hypothetical protein
MCEYRESDFQDYFSKNQGLRLTTVRFKMAGPKNHIEELHEFASNKFLNYLRGCSSQHQEEPIISPILEFGNSESSYLKA